MLAMSFTDVMPKDILERPNTVSIAGVSFIKGFKARGEGLPAHTHDEAQLTFAASGMVQVHTTDGRWLIPRQLAVWVPAGVPHRIDVLSDAELWMVHWDPAVAGVWAPSARLDTTFALKVTRLMRVLLDTVFVGAPAPEKAELVMKLMLQEVKETRDAPTFLPLPESAIGKRVVEHALADYQNRLSVEALASRAATSVRTLSRLFPRETGMTFKAWRQRARIVAAIDGLAQGVSIASVAADFGFSSTASFSWAFRQVTAMSPTDFLSEP